MAMRRPKSEMSPPAPSSPSDQRDAVIEELQKGAQLADSLRRQVELIPEPGRRDAALANVSDISTALASSLSVLQFEREQYSCSSSDAATANAAGASGGGGVRARNGALRSRKAKQRRGADGQELPIEEMLTETPENDGFHWRKYGEKKILNAEFPSFPNRLPLGPMWESVAAVEETREEWKREALTAHDMGLLRPKAGALLNPSSTDHIPNPSGETAQPSSVLVHA